MRFGSVCSGIEAASLAFGPHGWSAAWFSEIEPFPSAVLAHRFPAVPNHGDMTTLPQRLRAGEVEVPDMLVGGTPCQAFSVAGKRESLDDARGNLTLTFCEIADAIDDMRDLDGDAPGVVFWENVPGVLNTADNAFGCFLGRLAGEDVPLVPAGKRWSNAGVVLGPRRAVAWRILDAQYFGLAQRRRRVFVVASARDGFDPAAVLLEFDGVRRDSAPRREAREGAAPRPAAGAAGGGRELIASEVCPPLAAGAASGGGANGPGRDVDTAESLIIQPYKVGNTLTARMHKGINSTLDEGQTPVLAFGTNTDLAHTLNTANGGKGCSEDGTGRGVPTIAIGTDFYNGTLTGEVAVTLNANSGSSANHAGPGVLAFNARQDPDTWPELTGPLDTSGHTQADGLGVAFTPKLHNTGSNNAGKLFEERTTCLDANSPPPALLTPLQVRRLTPRECERLQGFPDDWTLIPWRNKLAADGPRYKAIGNSWAVACVEWIAARLTTEFLLS